MSNTSNKESKQKPLLFGNAALDATAIEDIEKFEEQGFDWSYVPGYSEQRQLNEHAVRDGHKPTPMDKLFWARVARTDGSDVDYRDAVGTSRLGYRACTIDDLRERGWGMPPSAHVAADGTIRREDTALAIVDFDRAQKNKQRQERINAEFEGRNEAPDLPDGESKVEKQGRGVSLGQAKRALLAK
jgi:hypothetical protein